MATESERFWPSLYDRLRSRNVEGLDDYFVDGATLRNMVKRDLELLLNATALESSDDIEGYPRIKNSVLNFGLPDLTGKIVSGLSAWEIQESLRITLKNYEPRIVADSLRVVVDTIGDSHRDNSREPFDPEKGLALSISGTILGTPMPESVYIQTKWDADLGEAQVKVE